MKRIWHAILGIICLSCTSSPKDVVNVNQQPEIYPDYIGVTIPSDIAPLNFNFADETIDCMDVVVKGSKGGEVHTLGDYADFDIDDWQALTKQNEGGKITFTVRVKANGEWLQYDDFDVFVSKDRLDEWGLTYRRIKPGY